MRLHNKKHNTMKHIIIIVTALLLMGGAMAQTTKTTAKAQAKDGKATVTVNTSAAKTASPAANVTGAEISFEKKTIDYGTLKVGDVRTVEMVYTNVGKKPLLLENVTTNCDCTEVEWSRKPLMPGKSDVIKVTYTAKNPGLISKWVTVMSNAETDRVILKTSGKVEE